MPFNPDSMSSVKGGCCLALWLLAAWSVAAQHTWEKFYAVDYSLGLQGITEMAEVDNGYLLLGSGHDSTVAGFEWIGLLIDHDGNELKRMTISNDTMPIWTERLGNMVKCGDLWYATGFGFEWGLGPSEGMIVALDDTLGIHWVRYYGYNPADWFGSIDCWDNRMLYTAGYTGPSGYRPSFDHWLMALDLEGNVLMDTVFGGLLFDITGNLVVDREGHLFSAPASDVGESKWQMALVEMDSQFNVLQSFEPGTERGWCGGHFIITPENHYRVLSCFDSVAYPGAHPHIRTIHGVNDTMGVDWTTYVSNSNIFGWFGSAALPNDQLVATNLYINDSTDSERTWLFKIDSDGSTVWRRDMYQPEEDDQISRLFTVIPTSDGGFLCGGVAFRPGKSRHWVVKLDSMGCLMPGCDTIGVVDGIAPEGYAPAQILLTLSPNPAQEKAVLQWMVPAGAYGNEATVQVLTLDGRMVYQNIVPIASRMILLPTADFAPGSYLVFFHTEQGHSASRKLVVAPQR